jgi:hypothetical protein
MSPVFFYRVSHLNNVLRQSNYGLLKDGSLLDEKGLELLAQMANEKDYQVWIERVETSGKVGFVMEEGMLVNP